MQLLVIFLCIFAGLWILDKEHIVVRSVAGAYVIWFTHCFFTQLIYFACARLALESSVKRNRALRRLSFAIRNIHQYKTVSDFRAEFVNCRIAQTTAHFRRMALAISSLLFTSTVLFLGSQFLHQEEVSWGWLFWHLVPVVYVFICVLYPTLSAEYEKDVALLEARAFVADTNKVWTDDQINRLETLLQPKSSPAKRLTGWLSLSAFYPLASSLIRNILTSSLLKK